jgi:hypothetical protein
MIISGILGLSPALILLWMTFRKYDYPFVDKTLFDDRKVFMMLALGIVFGLITAVLYAIILVPPDLLIILVIAIGLAIFEELFKFVVLNLKRFHGRFDTVFYGFSLGVGLSSAFVLHRIYISITLLTTVTPLTWISLIVYSVTLSLIHGSTGALIGYGAAKKRPWYYFTEVMTIRLFTIIALIPLLGDFGEEWVRLISLTVAFLLAAFVYRHIITDIMPGALPESLRRRKRRKSRLRKITKT